MGFALSTQIVQEKYGSTFLKGQIWKDKVCLSNKMYSPCVNDFPFIAIKEEVGLMQQMDGILGMGPQLFVKSTEENKLTGIDRKKNPDSTSLMQYFKESG